MKRSFKNITPTLKTIKYIISKAEVTLNSVNIKAESEAPDKLALRIRNTDSLIDALLAYLKSNARSLTINDHSFIEVTDGDEPTLDISLDLSLFHALISLLLFLKAKVKRSIT